MGEALKIGTKSGLKLRLALYSAEVQQAFMLTYGYLLFFSTVCRWVRHLGADVAPVMSAPKSGRFKSASSQKIV